MGSEQVSSAVKRLVRNTKVSTNVFQSFLQYFYVHTVHIDLLIVFIIIPTYAQISSVKVVLKLLRHVSVLINHLQGVYKLCQLKL
jgi:hypothetical protein